MCHGQCGCIACVCSTVYGTPVSLPLDNLCYKWIQSSIFSCECSHTVVLFFDGLLFVVLEIVQQKSVLGKRCLNHTPQPDM